MKKKIPTILQRVWREVSWSIYYRIHTFPSYSEHHYYSKETYKRIREYNESGSRLKSSILKDYKEVKALYKKENEAE